MYCSTQLRLWFISITLLALALSGTACGENAPASTDTPSPEKSITDSASALRSNEIIIVGNDYKIPKIYLEENVPQGILVDILHYADAEMEDHSLNIQLYPWARAYEMALDGKGGIIGLSKTEARLEIFDYSDIVYYDDVVIVVMKGQEFPYETLDDLAGKTVGIGRAGTFGDEFEAAKESGLFNVEEDNGPVFRLKKLLAGRIDAALISPGKAALYQTIQRDTDLRQHRAEFVVLDVPFKRDPNYLGFAKGMEQKTFLDEFNGVIEKGYATGIIQKIIAKYDEPESP